MPLICYHQNGSAQTFLFLIIIGAKVLFFCYAGINWNDEFRWMAALPGKWVRNWYFRTKVRNGTKSPEIAPKTKKEDPSAALSRVEEKKREDTTAKVRESNFVSTEKIRLVDSPVDRSSSERNTKRDGLKHEHGYSTQFFDRVKLLNMCIRSIYCLVWKLTND